ncbi:hypothetical protein DQW77_09835 [Roseovarius sp. TE539]|nr:hypothetical protein DQW77_09835 [Roseovarius sp. TE539]
MGDKSEAEPSGLSEDQEPALRNLVESALRRVASVKTSSRPRSRNEWIEHFCEALMSESETSHHAVLSALVSSGVTSEEVFQSYVPDAARRLGELWLNDQATFVEVTVGASRLQALFRRQGSDASGRWLDRSIPLGQSVLMITPQYEQHSLGAFVAADNLRRHGLWVHMAIGLNYQEIAEMIITSRFAMVGITASTWNSVEKTAKIIEYIRANVEEVPPIVIGGYAASDRQGVEKLSGADYVVMSAREAIERCGLSTTVESLSVDQVT